MVTEFAREVVWEGLAVVEDDRGKARGGRTVSFGPAWPAPQLQCQVRLYGDVPTLHRTIQGATLCVWGRRLVRKAREGSHAARKWVVVCMDSWTGGYTCTSGRVAFISRTIRSGSLLLRIGATGGGGKEDLPLSKSAMLDLYTSLSGVASPAAWVGAHK